MPSVKTPTAKPKVVSITGKDGVRRTYTPEQVQEILAAHDLEAKARAELRKLTGNDQIHEGIRVFPKYRLPGVPPDTDIQTVELIAFAKDWPCSLGGLGAFGHFKEFCKYTWPDLEWNEWLEQQIRSLTAEEYEHRRGRTRIRFVSWVGAGSAGKTFAAGLFACAWFIADPDRTSVTLTSTSKGIIAQRVWPVIQKLWWGALRNGERWEWGHMLESQKMVQAKKGDAKHSICALAVESGDLKSSLDRIKGRHTPRMMLIVDEANSTPQAIFECIPNMLTAVEELVVLVIGNAGSHLDPHGECCQPKNGWKSITIDDTIWPTKGVSKWGIEPGVCLHFDGAKSPNVIAGKTLHKHIYTYERWAAVERHGQEYRNTLQHWSQDRGFWPPDGLSKTIFTEALVISHDGMGKHTFLWESNPIGAMDPAFGGDDCLLQFGIVGDIRAGVKGIQLTDTVLVGFDPDTEQPLDYQIAHAVIRECAKRKVDPRWFGLDSTGVGRGVAAILQQEWSPQIHKIEFGGSASELPASTTDPRPSKEVYSNRVTELWYSARDLLCGNQLKGLSNEAVREFCARLYDYINKKYRVESKDDMKQRLGYSPDRADAVTVLCDVARRNGVIAHTSVVTLGKKTDTWSQLSRDLTELHNATYVEQPSFTEYADIDY